MAKFSLWRNQKGNNYKFIDHHVKQQIDIGGTQVLLHRYSGPVEQSDKNTEIRETGDLTQPLFDQTMPWDKFVGSNSGSESNIQDLFYLENRDRKYDPNVYELRGVYQVNDNDFDLKQFGFFLSSDNIMVSFHYNDMISKLGRKIMSGDVIELTHLRDADLLDKNRPAINKYYVVDDASRGAEGFDPHWHSHIWRCRCSPMQNQQEFLDILQREALDINDESVGKTLEEVVSTLPTDVMISTTIDEEANRRVPFRNYEQFNLYIQPSIDPETGEYIPFSSNKYPILLNYGDGIPPNGAKLVGHGISFPEDPQLGDFFLRTDYNPNILFRRDDNVWVREEIDYRSRWSAAHDALKTLINRTEKMTDSDGNEIDQRVYLSKVLKPKSDF